MAKMLLGEEEGGYGRSLKVPLGFNQGRCLYKNSGM
jgi:hypothetical protein